MATERFTIIKDEYDSNTELQNIASDVVECITFTANTSSMAQLNQTPDSNRIAMVDSAHGVLLPEEARKK